MNLPGIIRYALLLSLILPPPVTSAQQTPADSVRYDRLAALGRLWASVKYFHPALASQRIDWDSALVAAIPLVNQASDRGTFAAAVDRMLAALRDPSTHIAASDLPNKVSTSAPDPRGYRLADGTWVTEIHNYADLGDYPAVVDRMASMADSARKARTVIVDLRTRATGSDPTAMGMFSFAGLDRALVSRAVQAPVLRGRYYAGFEPVTGGTSGGYFSGDYTVRAPLIQPADSVAPKSVVFIISEASLLPPVALALQDAGLGRIVMEGPASEAPAIETMQLGVGEGLHALVRITDLVHADGRVGFVPDTLVATAASNRGDPGMAAALSLLNRPPTPQPARATRATEPLAERAYDESSFPSAPYRLLAAFRMWAAIRFFYAYRPLMGEDWDAVLRAALPKFEAARDSLQYALAVSEMWTHIHDSHGFVRSPALAAYLGQFRPPVRVRMVEGQPVVYQLSPDSIGRASGARVGDVILTVDGEPARVRMARLGRYIAASTPEALQRDMAEDLLRGPDSSRVVVTVGGADGRTRTLKLMRSKTYRAPSWGNRSGQIVRRLGRDLGYVDLDRLSTSMVDSMFSTLAGTRAIIFDMRGYPQGTAWPIAPRLTDRDNVPAARFYRMQPMWRDTTEEITASFVQTLSAANGPRYHGLTVMLIDERTQSQAEHTGLFLRAANGTTFIGSPTAGADGDVTTLVVPGGIELSFSGQGVEGVDGTRLQRVGLKPDVLVRPTLAGIRAGRDEVLERAVTWVREQLAKSRPAVQSHETDQHR
jgi:C-terminal processing protease CtpA/Prc